MEEKEDEDEGFSSTYREFSHAFGPLEIQLKFDPCRKFRIFSPFEISLLRNKPHRSLEDTLNNKICKKHHDLWHISALNLNGPGWTKVKFPSAYWLKNNENQMKQQS